MVLDVNNIVTIFQYIQILKHYVIYLKYVICQLYFNFKKKDAWAPCSILACAVLGPHLSLASLAPLTSEGARSYAVSWKPRLTTI